MTVAPLIDPASPAPRLLRAARAAVERQAAAPGDGQVTDELARALWAEQAATDHAVQLLGGDLLPRRAWLGYPDRSAVASLGAGLFLRWRFDSELEMADLTLLGMCPDCGTRWDAEVRDLVDLGSLLQFGRRCVAAVCPIPPEG